MDLKINSEALCIRSHSWGIVTKGNVYPVIGLRAAPCACTHLLVDVGIPALMPNGRCKCGHLYPNNGIAWLSEALFEPMGDISELMEIVNVETQSV